MSDSGARKIIDKLGKLAALSRARDRARQVERELNRSLRILKRRARC